ncbi:MAG TPA: peptide chain release factor 2, partial [Thermoanaerobaculia bacterium]|nr:peptide chain release factor 2 [Thermoanaerobaculia bacterium]
MDALKTVVETLETKTLLSGENDGRNAIVTIHPGAGGTESQDWAEMLLRMYLRYAERKGWSADIVDYQSGEEAGLKSATVMIRGDYAYGYMKSEHGVHRLVRISPFDAAKRRHTSFASVYVYPDIDEEIEIEINDKDLRVDTYRSSGAGGQHVNVTDSAVRITHIPTNIVVTCQNERSQHKNRDVAMKLLRSRLYQLEVEKRQEAQEKLEGEKKDIAFGSQIRSYVMQPYQMIKDLRTGYEVGDVQRVMDGDLDGFVEAYLAQRARTVAD